MAHDILSPSSAHCWMACPGAPALQQEMPPEAASPYAEEGTKAHEEAARAVSAVFSAEPYEPGAGDEDMVRHASGWANTLFRMYARRYPAFWAVERKLDISGVTGRPGASGTADFIAIGVDGTLLIADFKYGMGVEVEAERNPQLTIYALAAMDEFDSSLGISNVRLMIYQPRISPEPKVYDWDMGELADFRKRVQAAAQRAASLLGSADAFQFLVPGETQCRFCRAKASCPALREKAKEIVAADFDTIKPSEPLKLPETPEQIAKALAWLGPIEDWCAAVRSAAQGRLERGESVPGYKLVAGRKGARKWVPGAENVVGQMRIARSVLYKKVFITPAQAEKAVKSHAIGEAQWKKMQELITQSEGKPVIAREDDKRPAIGGDIGAEFSMLEGEPLP